MLLLLVGRAATTRLPHPTRLTPSRKAPAIRCCASDASTSPPPSSPALGESKSTLQFEEEPFHEGAAQRAAALGTALHERGFEAARLQALLSDPSYKGSPALRTYNSFVYPKSAASLANAEKPGRMVTIAQSIVFLVREQAAKEAAWLRNVDRAREEVDALAGERLPLHLVLDNIRSAHNVGNLLRAAEAARLEGVHACGITPTPPHPSLLKTAMGAAEYVPNSHDGSTLRVVRELKRRGVSVWACETTAKSVDLREAVLPKPLALVLGNELIGVDTDVLAECDGLLQIPCFGVKVRTTCEDASRVDALETACARSCALTIKCAAPCAAELAQCGHRGINLHLGGHPPVGGARRGRQVGWRRGECACNCVRVLLESCCSQSRHAR